MSFNSHLYNVNYYLKHRTKLNEKAKKRSKEQYKNNLEHKEIILNRSKERYQKTKNNPELLKVFKRKKEEYHNSSQGKLVNKACDHRRIARFKKCSKLTVGVIQEIYQDNIIKYKVLTCELCFKLIKFGEDSLDHKIPVCRVDDFPHIDLNAKENLCIGHLSCNQSKNYRTLAEWFQLHPEYLLKKEEKNVL